MHEALFADQQALEDSYLTAGVPHRRLQLVAERAPELALFDRNLPEARYVGELGLDNRPVGNRSLKLQAHVFGHILGLCA